MAAIMNKFERLVERHQSSIDILDNETGTLSDESEADDTVIYTNTKEQVGQKRKIITSSNELEVKRKKSDNSVILISDDNQPFSFHSPGRSNHQYLKDSQMLGNMIINSFPNSNNNSMMNLNGVDLTKETHRDSYVNIDLTADNNTVIDVDRCFDNVSQTSDCTLVSISNASLPMSGDSDVRYNVLQTEGISTLNPPETGSRLGLFAQRLFNGLNDVKNSLSNIWTSTQATDTVEDVILGQTESRNSIGSNIYHPSAYRNNTGLRMIIIDGNNVAMEHTHGHQFSVKGLQICIDYFLRGGHVVKAFVPRYRCKSRYCSDPKLLDEMEREGLVVYTPWREIGGRTCTSHDDRYIVQCAVEFEGVIVSGNSYRKLLKENPSWRFVIENRVLPFTWVDDMIMFPSDPFGRDGPTLEELLSHPGASAPPNCEVVILPYIADQLKDRQQEFCPRCECKYENRNTTIIN